MMKNILRTAGYILMLVFAYMAFQVCFTFIVMMLAMVYAVVKGLIPVGSLRSLGEYDVLLSSPATSNIYIWSMAIGLFLSSLAMLLFLYLIRGYRLKPDLLRSISLKPLVYSTLLVFSSMFALNIFVQWFGLEDKLSVEMSELSRNALGVITISLIAPLLEEVLFRGAIQGYMMRRYNPWVAIVCAALVFGVFHLNPVQMVYATLMGIVFGWIYYRTGSLLSVIAGHVLNNSMAALALQLLPEGEVMPVVNIAASSTAKIVSDVFSFVFFVALSVYFAIKLHAVQPPVPSPWRDAANAV